MKKEEFVSEMTKRGAIFLPMDSCSTLTFSTDKKGKKTVSVKSEPLFLNKDGCGRKKVKDVPIFNNNLNLKQDKEKDCEKKQDKEKDGEKKQDKEKEGGAWQKRQTKAKKKDISKVFK